MPIRRENPGHVEAVRAVLAAAFTSRFGFEHSQTYGVTAAESKWGTYFQVRVFERPAPPPRGPFVYAKPFSPIDGG
jgi:putative acetyltransferase